MPKSGANRRELICAAGGLAITALTSPRQDPKHGSPASSRISPTAASNLAIARLKIGNQRFVSGKPKHLRSGRAWRESLVNEQHPFAVIIGCADSRVPIELIFDQGLGDLFVIRNAGNVMMDDVMGSIEYASFHLQTKLVVVMGHEGCGAVGAALKSRKERATEPPELQQVLGLIDPAIAHLDSNRKDALEKGVEANVRWSVSTIVNLQKQRKRENDFVTVGGIYELKSGRVRFLDEPAEDQPETMSK